MFGHNQVVPVGSVHGVAVRAVAAEDTLGACFQSEVFADGVGVVELHRVLVGRRVGVVVHTGHITRLIAFKSGVVLFVFIQPMNILIRQNDVVSLGIEVVLIACVGCYRTPRPFAANARSRVRKESGTFTVDV